MYEFFSQSPERARRFANAMRSFATGPGFAPRHLTDNYPWAALGNGTVVDVGGSHGHICFALARKYPRLSLIVQDLAPIIRVAKKGVPADVADRVSLMAYDFLQEQPVRGADVYLFRWIFHNWSDKYCLKILRNLAPALKPGAKVVVNDNVLPTPGTISPRREAQLRSMDLTMLEISNSHEREMDDWAALFEEAGFEFQGAQQPAGSNLWILVAEWRGT